MGNKKFKVIEEGIISHGEMKKVCGGGSGCAFYGCPTNEPESYIITSCKDYHVCIEGAFHNCPMEVKTYFICPGKYSFCTSGFYDDGIKKPTLS